MSYYPFEDFSSTIRSIFSSAYKPGKGGFSEWVERVQLARKALLENKRRHEEELEKMKDVWADKLINEKKQAYQEQEHGLAKIAKDEILQDLGRVISVKESAYKKAMAAPADEQIRLLTTLQMRLDAGEHMTPKDFANTVPFLADNYHALKMLENLAHNSGIPFPHIQDNFREDVATVRETANNILRSIEKPDKDLGYLEKLFWNTGNAGLNQRAFDGLENLSYLTITPEDVKQAAVAESLRQAAADEQESFNDAGSNAEFRFCAKVTLAGDESITSLADQFHTSVNAIAELNPNTNLNDLYRGETLYIPSTRYSFTPGSIRCAQPDQIELCEKPQYTYPTGPNGEAIGTDVDLVSIGNSSL